MDRHVPLPGPELPPAVTPLSTPDVRNARRKYEGTATHRLPVGSPPPHRQRVTIPIAIPTTGAPRHAGPALDHVQVTATPELLAHVQAHGGSLFVRTRRRGIPFLHTSKEPRSLAGYEVFVVGEILVLTRLPARRRPEELRLTLEGRRRKQTLAAWDGGAYVA